MWLCKVIFRSPGRQSSLSQYNSLTWSIVFRRQFVIDTGEDSALHVHCSDLMGERALWGWYSSFTLKMVLKWLFISDTWEEILHVHCSGPLGDRAFQLFRVILGRCSCNDRAPSHYWGRLHSYCWFISWSWNGCLCATWQSSCNIGKLNE